MHDFEDLEFPLPALELQAAGGCLDEGALSASSCHISTSGPGQRLALFQEVRVGSSARSSPIAHSSKKHPKLWDAAVSLRAAGHLEVKVNEVRVKPRREAQQQQQQPQQEHWGQEQGLLEVACSGNLILPAYSYEPPADRHSALAVAVQVIVQHIASLAQEPSDVSTDTNVHGVEEADVSSGEAKKALDAPVDLRDRIYEMLRPTDWTTESTEPSGLTCTLRGYQRRALAWMAQREAAGEEGSSSSSTTAGGPSGVGGGSHPQALPPARPMWHGTHHPSWQKVVLPSGSAIYHNWQTGLLQRAPPFAPQPLSGGALADEMGLGKTVVALALILKRPPPSAWYAPAAPVTGGPQASPAPVTDPAQGPPSTPAASAGHPRGGQGARAAGATLIVATPALLGQWDNEIKQHAPSLKVVMYDGLKASSRELGVDGPDGSPSLGRKRKRKMTKRQKFEFAQEVWETQRQAFEAAKHTGVPVQEEAAFRAQLQRLTAADVVLVAYPVLRQEVHHARHAQSLGRSLRRPKRYSVVDSPLTAVHWWRVMLDEAQNVGDGFSQVGDMASLLRARLRWVVTGTPIGNGGLRDLHGLLRVLQHDPFADRRLWRACVELPYLRDEPQSLQTLEAVLKPIMWRNDKASVGDELMLPPRTLERVPVFMSSGERSFYQSVQDAAVPAHQALQRQAAAAEEAGPSEAAPSSSRAQQSRVEAARAQRAARAAEEAAGGAVLDLRKCCDHPNQTSLWRRQTREAQVAHGVILSIAEHNSRQADHLQNQLQASERDLCVLLNTLAATLLETPAAPESPATPKAKGKGKQKAVADGDDGSPAGPERKRRKTEQLDAAAAMSVGERRAEALAVLRRSRLISEEGIGATWGEPATDIKSASAAIRAWRPIQVSVLEQLADLLEGSDFHRIEGEDLAAMRAEARRKLDDINEVPREACMEKEVKLAQLTGKLEEAGRRVAALWDRAQAAGWQERPQTDGSLWCATLLSRCQAARAADVDQFQRSGVPEVLRPEEEQLIEARARLEGICVTPIVAATLNNALAVLSALQSNQPLPRRGPRAEAALVEVTEDVPEQRMLRLAREESTLQRALAAAHALRRLHPIDTLEYQKAVQAARKTVNALRREQDKLVVRRTATGGNPLRDAVPEAAAAALDAVCAQLDYVRALRECQSAQIHLDIARHNLGIAEDEARAEAAAVSHNRAGKSMAALRKEIAELERRCEQQLRQQRYLRGSESEQPHPIGGDAGDGPQIAERQPLEQPPPPPGTWPAGVRAATGLSAALGAWESPLDVLRALPLAASGHAALAAEPDHTDLTGSSPAAPPRDAEPPTAAGRSAAPSADPHPPWVVAEGAAANDAAAGDVAAMAVPAGERLCSSSGGQAEEGAGDETAGRGNAHVFPRITSPEQLAQVREQARARWLAQQDRVVGASGPAAIGNEANANDASAAEAEAQPGAVEENARKQAAECYICLNQIDFAVLPPCGHTVCETCYPKWYFKAGKGQKKGTCITCRQVFAFSDVVRAPAAKQRQDADYRDDTKFAQVEIFGSWGAKISALLRRLVWLQDNHPEIKSLVFSQWQGALQMVSAALNMQNPPIKHVSLTGVKRKGQGPREVIWQFQNNPEVRVFLLTRGQGAAGLTLTQASEVFLLEPSVNVAVEQQALARVHRLGQTRSVHITRFISNDTVEEEVVREAEATQSLLSEDARGGRGVQPQTAEDVSGGQLRRLLDAALRSRPPSAYAPAAGRPADAQINPPASA